MHILCYRVVIIFFLSFFPFQAEGIELLPSRGEEVIQETGIGTCPPFLCSLFQGLLHVIVIGVAVPVSNVV